uniref:Uncharacterized protein n=1 Tax=Molossus molossus TaxID=27622 RepID=A0A7J8E2C7_MOLMO|nr:hypothetical protein HJG59_008983 [Molossus molossus]
MRLVSGVWGVQQRFMRQLARGMELGGRAPPGIMLCKSMEASSSSVWGAKNWGLRKIKGGDAGNLEKILEQWKVLNCQGPCRISDSQLQNYISRPEAPGVERERLQKDPARPGSRLGPARPWLGRG